MYHNSVLVTLGVSKVETNLSISGKSEHHFSKYHVLPSDTCYKESSNVNKHTNEAPAIQSREQKVK